MMEGVRMIEVPSFTHCSQRSTEGKGYNWQWPTVSALFYTKSDLCSILFVCHGELVKESKSKKNELAAKLKAKVEGDQSPLGADASSFDLSKL